MKRGRGEEAESELAAAVRIKPEAQDTRRILALYYLNRNEPEKAIDVLRKGMQGGPSDAVSYYLMGESYLRKNDLNEARTYFIKAKEANPKYDLAYFRLASIDFMQEKQEEGIKEIRSLLETFAGQCAGTAFARFSRGSEQRRERGPQKLPRGGRYGEDGRHRSNSLVSPTDERYR